MTDERKSFVMYKAWAILLAGLSEEDAGQIIKAICSKELGKDYEITSQTANAVFEMISPKLDEDAEKYQSKCSKNKEIANERERKRHERVEKKHERATNVSRTFGDTDTDTDTESSNEDIMTSTDVDVRDTRVSQSDVKEIITAWNTLPEPVPKVQKLTEDSNRMKSLKARIKQYSVTNVLGAIDNVRHSPFLLGQVKDFVITFDWFIGPKNFPKVLDGNYLAHDRPDARSGTTTESANEPTEEEIEAGARRIEEAIARRKEAELNA